MEELGVGERFVHFVGTFSNETLQVDNARWLRPTGMQPSMMANQFEPTSWFLYQSLPPAVAARNPQNTDRFFSRPLDHHCVNEMHHWWRSPQKFCGGNKAVVNCSELPRNRSCDKIVPISRDDFTLNHVTDGDLGVVIKTGNNHDTVDVGCLTLGSSNPDAGLVGKW